MACKLCNEIADCESLCQSCADEIIHDCDNDNCQGEDILAFGEYNGHIININN